MADADGLRQAAERKGLSFGTAVNITSFRTDPLYRRAVQRECGIVVPENEMKWEYVEPKPGQVTHLGGDEIRDAARADGQRLRGTTLVWHRGMPDWVLAKITRASGERLMRDWIGRIAGRYRGQIESWDTVNEIVDLTGGRSDGLRVTPWLAALGPGYVDLAFHTLREVDPKAAGLWNEDDVCLGADWMEARRTAVLRLLETFLARGVPIRRFGLQSHLNSLVPLDETALRRFLARLAGLGLAVEITELDIDDRAFPADVAARDRAVADLARRYLDVVLDEPAVLNVLTWDIVDMNTWLNESDRRRPDGLPQRSLPLDGAYRRKPLWSAIRDAFAGAPDHGAARARARARAA
ncbi:endo-1,4-beta-xylanase [uncultured Enterovirga sp.]|uniref:endo-1,4-beta-xylanase n=1 Tax=uncultured Enterovirga sp. TaxID=2026352 RepID=UPI0035C9E6DE